MTKCKVTGRELPEAKHDRDFIIGVSIGLAQEHTAIAVLERIEELTGEAKNGKWLRAVRYEAPHLERLPLGAGYIEITEHLKELIADLPPHGRLRTLVDRTICGRPPIDHIRKAGLEVVPVMIMQSGAVRGGRWFGFRVPKDEMASTLLLVFQAGRLKIREALPEAAELTKELQSFRLKSPPNTGNDLEAWRERPSDDLVFAMMLPIWFGERRLQSILHLPPMPIAPIERRQLTLNELIELQPKPDPDGMERL
jgi:hypothetical protein